jgi:site-specific DNA recombinase
MLQAVVDDGQQAALFEQLRADQARLDRFVDDYADGTMTKTEYVRAKARVAERMDLTRGKLARLESRRALVAIPAGRTVRQAWAAGSLDWRRALIGAVVEHVVIHPGRPGAAHFDPSKIEVVWRA